MRLHDSLSPTCALVSLHSTDHVQRLKDAPAEAAKEIEEMKEAKKKKKKKEASRAATSQPTHAWHERHMELNNPGSCFQPTTYSQHERRLEERETDVDDNDEQ